MKYLSLILVAFVFFLGSPLLAGQWQEKIETELGGHMRLRGQVSEYDEDSFYNLVGTEPLWDFGADLRLGGKLYWGEKLYFEADYEAVYVKGDTTRKKTALQRLSPVFSSFPGIVTEDHRRLMDLTSRVHEGDDSFLYHRMDRLYLAFIPQWGDVKVGRQAVTWGNGFLFNPMDLVNPFAPTDIQRDYKVGDDMITTTLATETLGELQLLYAPRRDLISKDVAWDSSSLGGKLHFAKGSAEFDLMLARHYRDYVAGAGASGYLRDAAWRVDATWTKLAKESEKDGYLSFTANLDYSWVWWQKNIYAFAEFYYNGLGKRDYAEALFTLETAQRLERGEIFTLGKAYVALEARIELHPLLNIFATIINNINDPSGIIQPRLIWDPYESLQCILGGTIYYGGSETEYGGFKITPPGFTYSMPRTAYIRVTRFF